MIVRFTRDPSGNLVLSQQPQDQIYWIDIFDPSPEERTLIEKEYNVLLPFHHDMHQIEFSNRYHEDENGLYLSFNVVTRAAPFPESHAVTFILTRNIFISLRYSDPNPIKSFMTKIDIHPYVINSYVDVFVELSSSIVGKAADILELIGDRADELGLSLLHTLNGAHKKHPDRNLNKTLKEINSLENLLSKGYQSLSNMSLMIDFFEKSKLINLTENLLMDIERLRRDIKSLLKHAEHLTQKLSFQLQSTLGSINIEQTNSIKLFTVLAMIFIPPGLIAGFFGMNFQGITETPTIVGFATTTLIMICSSLGAYLFFKKKKWI